MNKDIVRQITNVIALLAAIAVNALANILPLNGQNTGQISDTFKVFFVPAGYVFGIWSVIYLLLLAFSVYQALPSQRANPRLRSIGYWFAFSSLMNGAWIFFWHYNIYPVTVVLMVSLLASLIIIYTRLGIGIERVSGAEYWLVNLPFSVYLGWITVATIANITDLLYFLNWNGFGIDPRSWASIMLAVASLVALIVTVTRRDVAFLLVLLWAFTGIAAKFPGVATVEASAWAASAAVAVMILYAAGSRLLASRRESPSAAQRA
jgi:translocator protein